MDSRWTDSLGVALLGQGLPERTTVWARAAERAGLGSLWVIEDYFHPGAYTLAAASAAVTGRIAIGLGVVNPYTRHPALVAMETAALAGIAPGRVVLGLGSSNRKWIEAQMAIGFKTPLRGLREGVEIVRRMLDGQRVTYTGEVFSVHDVALETPPAVRVPILLGVKGPRALALAAEIADGVHCSILASPAHVRRVRATTAAREDFTVIAYVPVAVADDGAQARAWVRPPLRAISARSTASRSWRTPASTPRALSPSATRSPPGDRPSSWSPTTWWTRWRSLERRPNVALRSPGGRRPGWTP